MLSELIELQTMEFGNEEQGIMMDPGNYQPGIILHGFMIAFYFWTLLYTYSGVSLAPSSVLWLLELNTACNILEGL